MKFGIFAELEHPRPWVEGGEQKLFEETLQQIELADRLGIDHVWAVEHHFMEEYSHSTAPEVFLAAAAARTKRIRIGHGVRQLPIGFSHPARIAEAANTLDIISGGRLEFGTGESGSRIELEGYGVDPDTKRESWTESMEQIANMMAMDPYPGYEGKFFSMPARNVLPKPVQKPHPPLWVACSNKKTIHLAARLGLGAMSFTFLDPADAKQWIDEYYEILKTECVPIGHTVNPNVLLVTGFGVHQQQNVAMDRFLDGIRFFQFALNHYYRLGDHKPGRSDIWADYQSKRDELLKADLDPLLMRNVANSRGAIGSVDQVREHIRKFQATGVDQLVLLQQGGKNKHEHICESMELFAKEIMPEFHEGEEERQRKKMEELAPYIEKAFERKKDRRPLRLPDEDIPIFPAVDYVRGFDRSKAYLGTVHDEKAAERL
ncbi:LLM class flavin-dependent oxidoreductase [Sphingobium lactosutens]|uniref:LLM class flavin-dependent oxidoreductase n=1 Tax=Sphingobium lactosutens TaxID=522773 RepID=UPI0015BB2071|nr:LLM class flavin-dependent oxidoreductase [Sphingobium lactosutens]NWK97408.1 LLM class flavin-dependent oxidoreductase [Sphingobium lactosutens]